MSLNESLSLDLINQKIELLKFEIQETIDVINDSKKKKCESSIESDALLMNIKKHNMNELDKLIEKRTIILNENKRKLNLEKEYAKVCRNADTMLYKSVKNKSNALEIMKQVKDNREKAKNEFNKMKEIETIYNEIEKNVMDELNIQLPAFLFFHKAVINAYNFCNFIEFTNEFAIEDNKQVILNRQKWLHEQKDKGKVYYDLYDKIVNEKEYKMLMENKKDLENSFFNNIHTDIYDDTLIEIEKNIKEYNSHVIKNKKIKDVYNLIINSTSELVMKSGIDLHKYLSLYYDIYIPINEVNEVNKVKNGNNKHETRLTCSEKNAIIIMYNDNLEKYKTIKEEINTLKKYITNTISYLNNDLNEYLVKIKEQSKVIKQDGKYFKKWSLLTNNEKSERFDSFSISFVNKLLMSELINNDKLDELNISLKKLLDDNFKRIKYKDLKWNIKSGIIENINCLKYDNENNKFYILDETVKEKNKTRKASSAKTIFNKTNDKIINEELVTFLIVLKKNKKLTEEQDEIIKFKNVFLEKIKNIFKIKRMNTTDREELDKKFNEIYNIIYNDNH